MRRLYKSYRPRPPVVRGDWEAGQQLLLTTTALKDARDWHRNEVRTIAQVDVYPRSSLPAGVGSAIRLSAAVSFAHAAGDAYQGEVGLVPLAHLVLLNSLANAHAPLLRRLPKKRARPVGNIVEQNALARPLGS